MALALKPTTYAMGQTRLCPIFTGHFRADLIRKLALPMISGRSGKLAGAPAKTRRLSKEERQAALPKTTKYLAMGTAVSSHDLSNPGQRMTAMPSPHSLFRQIDWGCHTTADRAAQSVRGLEPELLAGDQVSPGSFDPKSPRSPSRPQIPGSRRLQPLRAAHLPPLQPNNTKSRRRHVARPRLMER